MRKLLGLVTVLSLAAQASATEWHNFGARSMGMGGAGAALATGPSGAFWNPAGLGQVKNPSGVELPFGGHYEITGEFLEGANDLNKIVEICRANVNDPLCSQANIDLALGKMNRSDNGARLDFGGGVDVKVGKIAVFVNNLTYVGAKPFVSMTNTAPNNIGTNDSAIIMRGINVLEFGAGYGHEIPFLRGVLAGANVKGMVGKVGYQKVPISTDDPGGGSFGKFSRDTRQTFQPGLDVGLLWDMNRTWEAIPLRPRLSVVGRNVNNPKFNNPDQAKTAGEPDKFSLQGNARAGAAISPLPFWHIAADFDLTRNLTLVDGVASQKMGLGTEVNLGNGRWLNVPLRFGLSRNIADAGAKTTLHFGAGLHVMHVGLDLAFNYSPAKVTVQTQGESKRMPANAGVSAQLSVLFGG
jgi:hypothetical protein